MSLAGKVAIVTGGSKGMGSRFVDALVAEGAKVAIFARASAEADALAARHGDAAAAFDCDVADAAAVERSIAAAVARFGRLDILVNNAALFHPFLLEEATSAQVERHVGVNLLGPIWCTRAAIPHLRASRGHIVNISSESVRMPFPFLSVYAATKAGLETLSQGLRDELREDGIRVTVLRSGSVAGSTGGAHWDPEVVPRFFATIQRTGHAAFTGHSVEPETMARTLIAVLTLPADVSVDLIEARASQPANETSLARASANRAE
ncbi:SDR family oxidoreductase [Sphingomonas immobilis]|uniref:SDR family oxidoreductase n=1 Tax=Sphingomonas immobilis TaxID=3063997 RepID=A0ABT8ZZ45_9SPHN|nr:SDR family oxidoreductase [Sphingomonas sp. CA1-15]MDO7842255.1 SDR family oxidoreductase [Sphingomonas sp. CA1-15]